MRGSRAVSITLFVMVYLEEFRGATDIEDLSIKNVRKFKLLWRHLCRIPPIVQPLHRPSLTTILTTEYLSWVVDEHLAATVFV
jgi:hypothetical protein